MWKRRHSRSTEQMDGWHDASLCSLVCNGLATRPVDFGLRLYSVGYASTAARALSALDAVVRRIDWHGRDMTNAFTEAWSAMSKAERRAVRQTMLTDATATLSPRFRMMATPAQERAAAKVLVARTFAMSRAGA